MEKRQYEKVETVEKMKKKQRNDLISSYSSYKYKCILTSYFNVTALLTFFL